MHLDDYLAILIALIDLSLDSPFRLPVFKD
jgi:hypothetical protein